MVLEVGQKLELKSPATDLSPERISSGAGLNLAAHAEIEALCSQLYSANPARFGKLDLNAVQNLTNKIFDNLDPNLRHEQKLELISKLLCQTVPSGPMGIDNYEPRNDLKAARDPGAKLLICETYKGKTVLENLGELSGAALYSSLQAPHRGLTSDKFLSSIIQDLVDRDRIHQGYKNTCATTTAQWHDVGENPELYISQLKELLINGRSTNAEGKVILTLPDSIPLDERTLSCSLYQSSMMNAVDNGYDASTDRVKGQVGEHPGLFSRQIYELRSATTGKPYNVAYKGEQDYPSIISRALADRRDITAVVEGIGSGTHIWHDVNIVDMKGGYVYFRNPWPETMIVEGNGVDVVEGMPHICRMNAADFLSKTQYMVYERGPGEPALTPDGRDEKDFKLEQPAVFFTTHATALKEEPDHLEHLKKLNKAREEQQRLKPAANRSQSRDERDSVDSTTEHKNQAEKNKFLTAWHLRRQKGVDNG